MAFLSILTILKLNAMVHSGKKQPTAIPKRDKKERKSIRKKLQPYTKQRNLNESFPSSSSSSDSSDNDGRDDEEEEEKEEGVKAQCKMHKQHTRLALDPYHHVNFKGRKGRKKHKGSLQEPQ